MHRLGIVMDPIDRIKVAKDSSFAMLLAAQAAGWELRYMEVRDLCLADGEARASTRELRVFDDASRWHQLGEAQELPLGSLDAILMRKDPPFDMEYVYATYLLEHAEAAGCLVVNRPRSIRDCNEKLFTTWFPQCCPPTVVARSREIILNFLKNHKDIIIKPLDRMGGASVFRVREGDPNTSVILETLTHDGQHFTMAQRFIPEVAQGDKRILMIDGEPVPYALARIPAPGETRGNLAAGGRGEGLPLSERDGWICKQVGPALRERGLLFVGLDVIGDYLTEINVTSPTCIRELDALYGLNIAGDFIAMLETRLLAKPRLGAPA